MENENDLLKKDLAGLEKKEDIEKFIDDAELLGGNEEVIALAKEKIDALERQAESATVLHDNEKSQVEYLGGSGTELEEKIASTNEAIGTIKTEATDQIKKLENLSEEKSSLEKVAEMKSLDEAASLEEAQAYVKKLQQEYQAIGEKDVPKIKEFLSTITEDEMQKLVKEGPDQQRDLAYVKEQIQKALQSEGKEIKGVHWVRAVSALRNLDRNFSDQLEQDDDEQTAKRKEGYRFENFSRSLERMKKEGTSEYIQNAMNPWRSWSGADEENDAVALARQMGIITPDEIKKAITEYFDARFINNEYPNKMQNLLRSAEYLLDRGKQFGEVEVVKENLKKAGLTDMQIQQAETRQYH